MKKALFLYCLISFAFSGMSQKTSEKISKSLTIEGDWCSGTYELIADFNRKGTWQWSKDGVILEGESTNAINLANYGNGRYVVMCKTPNNKVIYFDEYEFKTVPGPKAGFEFGYLYAAGAVKFKNTSQGSTADFTWLWEFGDATTSTEMSPIKLYAQEGTYTVTLTVTDKSGCSNKTTREVVWRYPR